jgi:chromosome segregation ATPase
MNENVDVERAKNEHGQALETLHAIDNDEPRLLKELEAASNGGDHLRVVEVRDELDRLPVRRWSAALTERRAFLRRREAELAEQDAAHSALLPRRQELEGKLQALQAELNQVLSEVGDVQFRRRDLRYGIAQLQRQIADLERSEAAWGPVVRGKSRTTKPA